MYKPRKQAKEEIKQEIIKHLKLLNCTLLEAIYVAAWDILVETDDSFNPYTPDQTAIIEEILQILENDASILEEADNRALYGHKSKYSGGHGSSKRVICVETGQVFNSIKEAQDWLGKGSIKNAVRSKRRSGGYHWEYYEANPLKEIN